MKQTQWYCQPVALGFEEPGLYRNLFNDILPLPSINCLFHETTLSFFFCFYISCGNELMHLEAHGRTRRSVDDSGTGALNFLDEL